MCVPGCQEAVHRALSRRGFFKGAAAGFAATAVQAVPSEAATAGRFKSVIDLTHTMSPDFPTFFGVAGIELQKQFDLKKDGFNLHWWRIIEHAGTHLDAPIHFAENGATVDKIGVDALVVRLAVVDVAAKAAENSDYQLTRQDLAAWERRHGRLPDNCCLAMHSGWARHVADAAKYTGKDAAGFHFPGVAAEAADWLIKERESPVLRSTRCRSTTARPKTSRPTLSGCRRAAGGWRTSPIWTRSRRWAPRWSSARPRSRTRPADRCG